MDDARAASGPSEQRTRLRRRLIERRRALPVDRVASASTAILDALHDEPAIVAAAQRGPVAVYWPVRGEPDVRRLAAPHGRTLPGHPAAVPRLLAWSDDTELAVAWRHLRYPADGSAAVDATDHGLILVPALAFDRSGNRLGNGAGWYDRLLAGLSRFDAPGPLLVGVAHSFQLVDDLDVQPWDVPMHLVVTPDGVQGRA
ncbi:MAG: 5-formyltetrahydrofolate cyclo-ligase [Microthrixaceae bacterium]